MDSQVLIIEADAALARQMQEALAEAGATAEVIADGNEALSYLRLYKPAAIVLCVELGRLSGYSICNKLKKEPSLAGIPLLLTSSQASEETFEQHSKLKTHAEAYLKKPFTLAQLQASLQPFVSFSNAAPTAAVTAAAAAPPSSDLPIESHAAPAINTPPAAATNFASNQEAMHAAQTIDLWLDESAAVQAEAGVETTFPAALEAPAAERREVTRLAPHHPPFEVEAEVALPPPLFVAPPASPPPLATSVATAPGNAEELDSSPANNRQDLRSLRQKVSQLEQILAQKELEFNDRLLQESSRARGSIDLKKKISVLERDTNNHLKNLEQAREQAAQMHQAWQKACEELQQTQKIQQAQQHNEALLQEDKNRLQQQYTRLQQQHQQLEEEQRSAMNKLEARRLADLQIGQALQQAAQLLNELPL